MQRAVISTIGLTMLLMGHGAIAGESATTTSPTQKWADFRQRRTALLTEISDLEKKAATLRDLETLDKQIGVEDTQLKAVRESLAKAKADNKPTTELEASERGFSATLDRLKDEREERQSTEKDLRGKGKELDELEAEIGAFLTPEILFQKFKSDMSTTFAYLVAAVVVGFFFVAFWDKKVRRAIFGGTEGIQFVTLFSIVIAIILFGITGILEGKELAALLGGLSGYILGRGTGASPAPTPPPPPPPPQAAGGAVGGAAPGAPAGSSGAAGSGAAPAAGEAGDPGAPAPGASDT